MRRRIRHACAAAHAGLRVDAGMAKLVVGLSLAGVGENLVGLLGLLEKLFGFRVVGVAVGMMLHRQTAIGLLDVVIRGVPIDTQHFVVIAL